MADIQIVRCEDFKLRSEALECLLADLPESQRVEQRSSWFREGDSLQVFAACSKLHVKAAIAAQLLPGPVGQLGLPALARSFAPSAEPLKGDAVGARLLRAGREWLIGHGALYVQCLLAAADDAWSEIYKAEGFIDAGELAYLACDLRSLNFAPPVLPADTRLHSVGDSIQLWQRLVQVVEQTYVGTHDWPVLNGLRRAEDSLASYRDASGFSPQEWLLLEQHDRDVGCILFNVHEEGRLWELIYMGIMPSARGQGWGRRLVEVGLSRAHGKNGEHAVLAVDGGNAHALEVYFRCGFLPVDQRRLLLWLPAEPPPDAG